MGDFLQHYGPVALVTGASSGIGEAFTRQLVSMNFTVFAVARRGERLSTLQASTVDGGSGRVIPIVADLQKQEGVDAVCQAVDGSGLQVDLLVNNAGFGLLGTLESVPRENVLGMVDLNCRAVADLTWRLLPSMKERRRGGVIIISSVVGTIPTPWFAVYSATKAFDLYFGEALFAECRTTGVDVLTVLPGLTRTEFQAGAGLRDYHSPYRSAEQVVQSAMAALGKKPIVVDGAFNKILSHGSRLLPRGLLIALSRRIMRRELRIK